MKKPMNADEKKRILIYGINYAPELTGIGKYTGELAAWLASHEHDVNVITAHPYYPDWEVHPAHKGKWWTREVLDGVKVFRCPLYVPKNVTSTKRILHEFSFLLGILPWWFMTLFQKKFDVVLCISPPFHIGILPLLYAKIRGVRFINHIQDLQVDVAKDLGMIKNRHFLKLMFALEKAIFEWGGQVSTISEGMQRKIQAKGIDTSKVILFPNWVDSGLICPLSRELSLRKEFGINNDDKVVLYSGNLGEKQGLEIIIEVAKLYKDQSNLHFVICGSGGGRDKLIRSAKELGLSNVKFYPLQPYENLSALLAMADIHLVLQKKSASDLVMPSKLTGILAAAGCVIVSAVPGTTLHEVITNHRMGILIEPENVAALAQGIEMALHEDLNILRTNAREYAQKYLTKNTIIGNFETNLLATA
ncbi:WcaI family glycosyltransferase [Dyadobacter chenwenxiniae]|uniref:WcaI family glycosyltransferase n=1 Tax=Dyadobacter chenwenxiniae TaxID=2906456 RepID=A0A9X1TJU9_9BACT|nr:WcaI family glycosyltransferase [Dyadobacter chenwenxiniae]MCF0051764.1 WcaI family glycosyltransferase [Dyadobacter chenwenxiniae]MCF0060508.1 WcaI family glycosyltransferase [Dyadobacter chenwenxiniae]UON86240.1 WcaI family glycosyltransferase [Dyadobacter chenwenxiniae]